jgi:oxepin-CoA hydrolase/3-oxo-5,6-dehydrosuberyl-CoA semialdehyde dehydrogenase
MAKTNAQFIDFQIPGTISLLENLKHDTVALWGTLNATEMLLHLAETIAYSNGKTELQSPDIPHHTFDHLRKFLVGPKGFPKGFVSPLAVPVEQNTVETFSKAYTTLLEEIQRFRLFWETHPEALKFNPIFGMLNKEQWMMLHNKHFTHHFQQFGLIDLLPSI